MNKMVDAQAYISSRKRFGIKPGLLRTQLLLDALGNPEAKIRFIHVAGTNGKGSTCVYLASVLEHAGYRVGLYTSPELNSFSDRMMINGEEISEHEIVQFTMEIKRVLDVDVALLEDPPTEFEVTTALSFLYFAAHEVDLVVLEAGLGGRYDATNVVTPMVCAITNVSYDHMDVLGTSLEEIAYDKAGIIKQGIPIVTGARTPALGVIESIAQQALAPCFVYGRDFYAVTEETYETRGQRFSYFGIGRDWYGVSLKMVGLHQVDNAAVALGVLEVLQQGGEIRATDRDIRGGFSRSVWRGRLEVVSQSPIVLLDGAHNPAGAMALAEALGSIGLVSYILVTGVLKDKDIRGILQQVVSGAKHVIATAPGVARAADPSFVADVAREYVQHDTVVEVVTGVAQAVQRAMMLAKDDGKDVGVCVMGSLYTVAEARRALLN